MTYAQYGDDDVLELTDQPTPKVGPGEILVEVRAASVNPVDWKLMSGGLDAMMDVRFPVVPGWDVAGVVSAVGIDTPEFAVGDEVVAYNRQDYVHRGTFAELTTVPVRAAARKPRDLSWEEAASLPLAGLTAFQALERLEVGPEDTVLVHGAGGGVGSFAVQLAARAFRARVIGSASASQHDRIRDLGGEPVEYGDGLADAVRELAPDGVSVVLDPCAWRSTTSTTSRTSPTRSRAAARATSTASSPSASARTEPHSDVDALPPRGWEGVVRPRGRARLFTT
ncbi:NADP-dependent oxidoreductase [Aeromicrobium sp. REDSEA-S38_B2]|uniref:NADP-dependent oxidoreductase n=1 Tax=Aeromicrobium sp. REDSEA-S38_B2 TaxID=1811528 RepID=UPI00257CFD42|nr:NADP-dependent oxidoreductase [Aeromicrobium sp. REDSEA-S38_B2]